MRHLVLVLGVFLWVEGGFVAGARADAGALRQVAGVLDYIAGDYRGAVSDQGVVIDEGEYREQLSLVVDADGLAAQAGIGEGAAARSQLKALKAALEQKATPAKISELCRHARDLLVTEHGLILGPSAAPSHALGEKLYREQACTTCHGVDGAANTEAAAKLDPRPANFIDPERVAAVSPHRAFYAITYGVAGTGMAGFGHLDDHARWSLAFYVLAIRHAGQKAQDGRGALAALSGFGASDAAALAGLTEEDIQKKVAGLDSPEHRAAALAYLRAVAPFEASSSITANGPNAPLPLGRARTELRDGLAAFTTGNTGEARQRFVAAYLDGFEPHEAALASRDSQLVRQIEVEMLGLREHAAQAQDRAATTAQVADVKARVARIEALLDRAEGQRGDADTAMYGALAITLREGLEAVLLASALLLLVRRRGAPELVRYVHAGWIAAVILGGITWLVAGKLLSGMQRELAEGIAALLAATVLLGVTHWLLGQLTAQRFMGMLATKLEQVAGGKRAALGVFGLSFIAVYREAFEVVLFFQALLLDAGEAQDRVWLGAGLGLAALIASALVLRSIGQRLKPRPLMLASSVLLAVLSFALAGKGVRALQEGGLVSITSIPFPEVPLLGIFGTVQGLVVQGLLLLALIASAGAPLLAARRQAAAPAE